MNLVLSVLKWFFGLPLWLWRCVFVVYALVLLYSTHNPQVIVSTTGVIPFDKQLHIAAFGLWTLLFIGARFGVKDQRTNDQSCHVPLISYRALCVYSCIGLLWAGLDEWTQSLPFINRQSQWGDWVADSIGVLGATFFVGVIYFLIERDLQRKHGTPARR